MSKYDEVRERVAKLLLRMTGEYEEAPWEEACWEEACKVLPATILHYRFKADQILSDPDILIKSDNQELPLPNDEYNNINTKHPEYRNAVNDLLRAGWVKTEPKDK